MTVYKPKERGERGLKENPSPHIKQFINVSSSKVSGQESLLS